MGCCAAGPGQVTYLGVLAALLQLAKLPQTGSACKAAAFQSSGQTGPGMGPQDPGMMQYAKPRAPKIKDTMHPCCSHVHPCPSIHPSSFVRQLHSKVAPAAAGILIDIVDFVTLLESCMLRPTRQAKTLPGKAPGWPHIQRLRNLRGPRQLVAD